MGEEGPFIDIRVGAPEAPVDTAYTPAVGDPVRFTTGAMGTVESVGDVILVAVPADFLVFCA